MAGHLSLSTGRSDQPIKFSHQIHITLTNDNYLVWKLQILPILRGYDLLGFIDGSTNTPPRLLTTDATTSVNPAFTKWHQEDQLILAWLFSSISASVLPQVLNCETSKQLWDHLYQINTSQSLAKVLELKLSLQTSKKGSLTCVQFIQHIQSFADRLRSVGSPISEQDLVLYTLQGLGSEFDPFVTAFSMRSTAPSLTELQSLLLAHEARLHANLNSLTTASANLTLSGSGSTQSHIPSGTSSEVNYTNTSSGARPPSGQYYNNSRRGRNGNRGRGRGQSFPNSGGTPLYYQICSKQGHTAVDCYHRFDVRYTGKSPAPTQPPQQPQALLAEPVARNVPDPNWYIDSGATSHVTPDINNLSSSHPYTGTDTVHIGNGAGLSISNIGSTILSTDSVNLRLNHVLHVPHITKNLLSISQLLRDNNISVEFLPDKCLIKD